MTARPGTFGTPVEVNDFKPLFGLDADGTIYLTRNPHDNPFPLPWKRHTELEHIVAKHLPSPNTQSKPGWFRRWITDPEPDLGLVKEWPDGSLIPRSAPAADWQPPYGSPGWPAEPPREVPDDEWLTDKEVAARFDPHGVVAKYSAEGNVPGPEDSDGGFLRELNRNLYQEVVFAREDGLIDGLTLAIQHLEVRANAIGDNMVRHTINTDIACLSEVLESALEKRSDRP